SRRRGQLDQFAGAASPAPITSSTVSGFFVVHKTEDAREFIETEVASPSFSFAAIVFRVPVSQEDITVLGSEVGITNPASKPEAWRALRAFQMRHRIQTVHQRPPCGTKKQSSCPVDLLMNRTGVRSGVSLSFMMSGGMIFHSPSFRYCHWSERSSATLKRVLNTSPLLQQDL